MKTEIKHHKVEKKRPYNRKAKPKADIPTMIQTLESLLKMLRSLQ